MSSLPVATLPHPCPVAARGLTVLSTCDGCSSRPPAQLNLEPGAVLARQGTPADRVFVIVEGWVRESVSNPKGGRTTTRFVGPGHLVGADALSYGVHHTSLDVVQPARVCTAFARNISLALSERPRLGMALARSFTGDLEAIRLRVARSAQCAHDAVLSILRELLAGTPEGAWGVLPVSRSDLAEALGLTLETVSRQVQQLRREGLIDVHGRHVRLLPPPPPPAEPREEARPAPELQSSAAAQA